ncbi:hypothetical protein [Pedobacter duraquae]|uniref:Uncharacterized protein n=1 Tax=Pedobacter duraquae TaxID=425511 RepID=A0A4R6IEI0_9SPHI|nr:hypothetical protein [Pedobacter duraquae]TDO20700.1 hypothetical protein CLV32_3333 [Pedobacter duraquae]
MKNQIFTVLCISTMLYTIGCKNGDKELKIKKINIETLDFKNIDVNRLYENIGYKRSDLVPHDSLGYYMIERGVYYKVPFDFFDAQKDKKSNDDNPFKGYTSYEVLDWLDSDLSDQEAKEREKLGLDRLHPIRQIGYFHDLNFEYINFIADPSGKVKAAILRTRQNKTDKNYFIQVMHNLENKLGKPFKTIREAHTSDRVTWPMETNIWFIGNRMYQFSTLINANQREGIQLLVMDKALVKKFDSNKNPKFTVYLNYDSLHVNSEIANNDEAIKSLAKR